MSRLSEGSQLGRYRILRRLGAGAMGEVYLAEDPQIGRQLALKTVRLEEGKPREVEDRKQRLLREARAAGKLLHPQIVTLFDAGEDGGLLYLAFEYVDGSDLDTRLADGPPLTLAEALAIVRQAAEGLEFAHRQGVVHRDVKPSNLMLTADGRVKVADFGIAKLLDSTSDLTMSGSVVGSPHYLSPEQVRNEPLDGRTDIFSLGVMLYEMLCRQRPFDGQTLTTLVYQILHQEPTPIEVRRPDLGPRVERLVRRMMHKEREQRFASAAELADEIRACERDLAPDLLARSLASEGELPGPTVRLDSDAATGAAASAAATGAMPTASMPEGAVPPPPPRIRPPEPAFAPPPRGRLAWLLGAAAAVALLLVAVGVSSRRWAAADGERVAAGGPPARSAATAPAAAEPRLEPEPETGPEVEDGDLALLELDPEPETMRETEPESNEPFAPGERAARGPLSGRAEARREAIASDALPSPAPPPGPPAGAPALERTLASPPAATRKELEAQPAPGGDPAPVALAPPPDPRAMRDELIASIAVARELTTAMTLSFEIEPKEVAERLVVRLDRIVLGRAADWNAAKRGGRPYLVPEPGLHIVTFLVDGADVYRIRIDAQPGRSGPTRIHADLSQYARRGRKRPGRR